MSNYLILDKIISKFPVVELYSVKAVLRNKKDYLYLREYFIDINDGWLEIDFHALVDTYILNITKLSSSNTSSENEKTWVKDVLSDFPAPYCLDLDIVGSKWKEHYSFDVRYSGSYSRPAALDKNNNSTAHTVSFQIMTLTDAIKAQLNEQIIRRDRLYSRFADLLEDD